MANEDKKKGVWIPEEVLELEELNGREMIVLSYYLAFTEKGKQKQCVKKIETVSEELHIPVRTLKRIRAKLKELGYLDTQFLFRGIGTKTNDIKSAKNGTSNRSAENDTPKRCRSAENGTFRSAKNGTSYGAKNGTSQYNEQYLMNSSNEHLYNVSMLNVPDTGIVNESNCSRNVQSLEEEKQPLNTFGNDGIEDPYYSVLQTAIHKTNERFNGKMRKEKEFDVEEGSEEWFMEVIRFFNQSQPKSPFNEKNGNDRELLRMIEESNLKEKEKECLKQLKWSEVNQ